MLHYKLGLQRRMHQGIMQLDTEQTRIAINLSSTSLIDLDLFTVRFPFCCVSYLFYTLHIENQHCCHQKSNCDYINNNSDINICTNKSYCNNTNIKTSKITLTSQKGIYRTRGSKFSLAKLTLCLCL